MKLTIELVPKTCWYTNVRSNVSKYQWDKIRKHCYLLAGGKCEICKDTGFSQGINHAVECHEIWTYDDQNFKQILNGLISLCPMCHKVKHIGFAQINGELDKAANHLAKVNLITLKESYDYINNSFKIWSERSKSDWITDISYLDEYLPK